MEFSARGFSSGAAALSRSFARAFPTPALISPRAAGIDISDRSVKWIALSPRASGYAVESWGQMALPEGAVAGGAVRDAEAVARALGEVRQRLPGISCAHAALPEEAAYVFEMHVPEGVGREETLHLIEFEFEGRVPIPPRASMFDFDLIQRRDDGEGEEIAVAAFPRELAQSYAGVFERAGFALLSLELEARSIARAVSSTDPGEPITLLADFGRARTGLAVVKRGIPIFTSTVEIGGDAMSRALMEKLSLSEKEAIEFRNEQGLRGKVPRSPGVEAIAGIGSALADEIVRHFHYWDTRRDERGERMTPVGQVVLVGGSANLNGLPDYIAGRVHAPAERGDVWRHVCDFDEYIPPIPRRASLQYATAIGLALRSQPAV